MLTTTELIRMIDAHGINFEALPSESCDMPFGIGSGGGVIFGTTGGVTESGSAPSDRGPRPGNPACDRGVRRTGRRGHQGNSAFP